jgi:hypothetical protein
MPGWAAASVATGWAAGWAGGGPAWSVLWASTGNANRPSHSAQAWRRILFLIGVASLLLCTASLTFRMPPRLQANATKCYEFDMHM